MRQRWVATGERENRAGGGEGAETTDTALIPAEPFHLNVNTIAIQIVFFAKMGRPKAKTTSSSSSSAPVSSPSASAPKSPTHTHKSPSTKRARRPAEKHQLVVWLLFRGLGLLYLWFYFSSFIQVRTKYPLDDMKAAMEAAEALQTRIRQSKPRVAIPTVFGIWDDLGVSPLATIYGSVVTGIASSLLLLFGVSWTPLVALLWSVNLSGITDFSLPARFHRLCSLRPFRDHSLVFV